MMMPTGPIGTQVQERLDFIKNVVKKGDKWDCLLTSYEQLMAEASRLKRINFRYLIVDEAHRIKVSLSSGKVACVSKRFKIAECIVE